MRSFVEGGEVSSHGNEENDVNSQEAKPRTTTTAKSHRLPDSLYDYDLFCVVTHEGKLDNGHYWADVWSEGEWWHCDDDKGR